ncbi:hypothetical protein BpHYR1_022356 [Brachionus plicatilis]|uniref:Uncharacterized protein n=1 Tax=Brachionus plicatilis TaxID=10195 RepID=A0A3M7P698_BRAPC|nr:hypothetical protein BpHYR1_022356 [Brachionus plicatilis]
MDFSNIWPTYIICHIIIPNNSIIVNLITKKLFEKILTDTKEIIFSQNIIYQWLRHGSLKTNKKEFLEATYKIIIKTQKIELFLAFSFLPILRNFTKNYQKSTYQIDALKYNSRSFLNFLYIFDENLLEKI